MLPPTSWESTKHWVYEATLRPRYILQVLQISSYLYIIIYKLTNLERTFNTMPNI